MSFVRESEVPHLSATLSERCTGERRTFQTADALPAMSACFTEKMAGANDIQDCTDKEFL